MRSEPLEKLGMKKHYVCVETTTTVIWEVLANSPNEAKANYDEGEIVETIEKDDCTFTGVMTEEEYLNDA